MRWRVTHRPSNWMAIMLSISATGDRHPYGNEFHIIIFKLDSCMLSLHSERCCFSFIISNVSVCCILLSVCMSVLCVFAACTQLTVIHCCVLFINVPFYPYYIHSFSTFFVGTWHSNTWLSPGWWGSFALVCC